MWFEALSGLVCMYTDNISRDIFVKRLVYSLTRDY